jgi:tmRNA-binding protein
MAMKTVIETKTALVPEQLYYTDKRIKVRAILRRYPGKTCDRRHGKHSKEMRDFS